jgi:biotin carboxylase
MMDEFDRIIAQAHCIVNSEKVVDEMENMKSIIDQQDKLIATAEQRGYGKGEEHGYACGWKQAMVAVENNGCSKLGMITIPISLLRLLSDKYLKEEGKNGKQS